MKNIEMHCHSTLSDGKNTPEQVIDEAKRLGLDFLALTDHDTIAPQEFQDSLKKVGIETCDSVEISARNEDLDKSLHLVSYAKIFKKSLHDILDNSMHGKMKMKAWQLDMLISNHWFEGSMEWFDTYMKEGLWREPETSNKYDMARYLHSVEMNEYKMREVLGDKTKNWDVVGSFYEQCLKRGWALYDIYWYESEEYEPSVEQAVDEVVTKAGWIISMAHPNVTFSETKWWIPEFQRTIWNYVKKWINGIEINTMASPEWVHEILAARQKYDLILTFGSDCHNIGYDWADGKHSTIWKKNPNMSAPDLWKQTYRWISFTDSNFLRFQNTINIWND